MFPFSLRFLRQTIMRRKLSFLLLSTLLLAVDGLCRAAGAGEYERVELARYEDEHSVAHVKPAKAGDQPGLAIHFEGTEDLHYYAKSETAPAQGLDLKVGAKAEGVEFGTAVLPKWSVFTDPLGKKVEVYAGNFTVFVPVTKTSVESGEVDVEVSVSGIACTSKVCLRPFEQMLKARIKPAGMDAWPQIKLDTATSTDIQQKIAGPSYPVIIALWLALLAGLSLNIMPCVWPVLPIIVMRLVEQAKHNRAKSVAMGLAFCVGILLFFACLAGANIVLQLFYGTVLQWGDQLRNPAFVAAMALLLVVLALFMFGVFTITVPSSISSKSGAGRGYTGAVGMGFLAAILSTPCSFAILAAAFAWAQAQPLPLATLAIMVIGAGMSLPYAILTAIPGLLSKTPKPGRWMELFKQAIGFVLLVIAVKLIGALPAGRRIDVLYFSVVLAFCVWMWGGWVSFGTAASKKWTIRIIAVALAVAAGFAFLPEPKANLINWQQYDAAAIEQAKTRGQAVLIEFTADWCLNCAVVEKLVYSREDIAGLIKKKDVLAVKADTTASSPATIDLKNTYNEPGVPVTILLLPDGTEMRWRGMRFANELKKLLEKL